MESKWQTITDFDGTPWNLKKEDVKPDGFDAFHEELGWQWHSFAQSHLNFSASSVAKVKEMA